MRGTGLEETVMDALATVTIGENGPSIVAAGLVHDVVATGGAVRILLDLEKIPDGDADPLAALLTPLVGSIAGVERVVVKPRPKPLGRPGQLAGIGCVLAVHSGKGGVGKSTLAANLAVAFAGQGLAVGLLDADVYGPSAPTLFGVSGRVCDEGGKIQPKRAHGVSLMSLGFLMPAEKALAWRGSLVDEGLPQLLTDVAWGALDILVVDLPPGTSDVHLGIARHAAPNAVLTVTTPGAISVQDVERGMEMFADVAVPCIGLVENMARLTCGKCGHGYAPFGEGGGARLSAATGLPLLASIPFLPEIADSADAGMPFVLSAPDGAPARAIKDLAHLLADSLLPRRQEISA
ncbi:Mrp/NBP35 family ATP-binding protein [Magnetospirillum sp. 64-120]|uniref:Mrp/NBP35 family ATP-binding protein n=1 Tax=Magnetospirillum sp. 64-120 TaxID=1895778 RepID=UPI00092619E7|nr:Mrp/NBP35 family ATP-binding protein [Magnetospirillum sp. 64-120]OJX78605.1 MAG: hypothetical protein BGO92_01820 [Magnetospirillum sp. 64-120]